MPLSLKKMTLLMSDIYTGCLLFEFRPSTRPANVINVSNAKCISVHQALFLCARDEANYNTRFLCTSYESDGDEVIHTSLIHRPSFVFYRVVMIWLWQLEGKNRT